MTAVQAERDAAALFRHGLVGGGWKCRSLLLGFD